MKTWFKKWFNSPYYHLLYQNRDIHEAANFIDHLVDHLNPAKDAMMLDLACGSGRHSIQLAKKGFDVTGIDLSEESIALAQKHEHEHLHFFVHDMRLPFWVNYFDYVMNLFTSFGYFDSRREHSNALRTMAQCLKPGGSLILDYINVELTSDAENAEFEKQIGHVKFKVTKWSDPQYYFKKIIVQDNQLQEELSFVERVAKFNLNDFKEMFAKHHLHIKEIFGDYQLNSFDPGTSPRLIMQAEKMIP